MSFALGVLMDVFFGKAGEEDAVKAGVESAEVSAAHVADARLGLERGAETEAETTENTA